ncbi:biotin--[acetyl-CoA-carboxylase] ligase [Cumulibacter soli]|uniref:biotin--[acetyl-CoA-carboxylase] ligase n=1 Tax=Cumulibacter soli TaxID=2546344 RepID=UPI001FBBF208|nr:biotin--[acetyl-CoA-carboxylase] ligase [Cumulibacter soli]
MLNADLVRRDLDPFWTSLEVVEQTGSTNDDVLAAAGAGTPQGMVRVAEFQSAGRGRLSRQWEAPPRSSVMFSVLLRPSVPMSRWGWIPLLTGLAIHDVLLAAGADVALKWPNDVQLGPERKKCGGILTQATADAVVVGIGLNAISYDGMPEVAAAIDTQWQVEREDLLRRILNSLASRYVAWDRNDGSMSDVLDAYRAACGTIGQRVKVILPGVDDPVIGTAHDVDADGRLMVQRESGEELIVGAGDVVHVRPVR